MNALLKEAIKTGNMVGEYSPAHEILIGGGLMPIGYSEEEDIKSPSYRPPTCRLGLNPSISHPVPTSDGRYLVVWTDPDTKEVMTAYSEDLTFFTEDDVFVEGDGTGIILTTMSASSLSLYRNDSGTLLLFAIDIRTTTGSSLSVYSSASGNGDDFALSEIIYENEVLEGSEVGNHRVSVPKMTQSGRLVLSGVMPKYSSVIETSFPYLYIWVSDDGGLSWTKKYSRTYLNWIDSVGQVEEWEDVLYCEVQYFSGQIYILKSSDGGETWSFILTDFSKSTFSDRGSGTKYYGSFFNDTKNNVLLRICPSIYSGAGIYKLNAGGDPLEEDSWEFLMTIYTNWEHNPRISYIGAYTGISWSDREDRCIILALSDVPSERLIAESIDISYQKAGASSSSVAFDNYSGVLSPDKPGRWNKVFWPNTKIRIRQGYGLDVYQTFNGYIDDVDMSSYPHILEIKMRDELKRALDQEVSFNEISTVTLTGTLESMFVELAYSAGFTDVEVEPTGITMTLEFNQQQYSDAFQTLCELSGFIYDSTEFGKLRFYEDKNRQPEKVEVISLLEAGVQLSEDTLVVGLDSVTYLDNPMVRDEDYSIDYENGIIFRIPTGSIPEEGSVEVTYVYAAWTFEEGKDLIQLKYNISDSELYAKIVVTGKADEDGKNKSGEVKSTVAVTYKVGGKKVMRVSTEFETNEECLAHAQKLDYLQKVRARKISFSAIAIPDLKIGDCIRVLETSTTISDIYRITDLSFTQDSKKYTMSVSANYFGYTA